MKCVLIYKKIPDLVNFQAVFNICPAGEEVQRHDVRGFGECSRWTRPCRRWAELRAASSHHRRYPSFCRQDDPGQIQCNSTSKLIISSDDIRLSSPVQCVSDIRPLIISYFFGGFGGVFSKMLCLQFPISPQVVSAPKDKGPSWCCSHCCAGESLCCRLFHCNINSTGNLSSLPPSPRESGLFTLPS